MANFSQELAKLMGGNTPAGGFGLEDLQGRLAQLQRDFALGSRRASAQDQFQLGQRGLGNSVSGALSQGRRSQQGLEALLRAMMSLKAQDKGLKNDAYFKQLSIFAPLAQQNANRPSFLSGLVGGILGLGGKALGGYLGGMGANKQLESLFGGGGSPGQGFASTSNFNPLTRN